MTMMLMIAIAITITRDMYPVVMMTIIFFENFAQSAYSFTPSLPFHASDGLPHRLHRWFLE
jgi:hypothetical protein